MNKRGGKIPDMIIEMNENSIEISLERIHEDYRRENCET